VKARGKTTDPLAIGGRSHKPDPQFVLGDVRVIVAYVYREGFVISAGARGRNTGKTC
jgi:hypothetical protein